MDNKAFGIAGALTLIAGIVGYTAYKSKKSQTSTPIKNTDKSLIIRILQQLKHQIFLICLEYSTAFRQATKQMKNKNIPIQTIQKYKETQILKIFQEKQRLVLVKYGVTKEEFELALNKTYLTDQQIQLYNTQIQTFLVDAIEGKPPKLDIPVDFKKALNKNQALQLFKNMQVMMIETLLTRFLQQVENNKEFDIKNSGHIVELIKKINLFQLKSKFVINNGPKVQSCNHSNFVKLIQSYKREFPDFKSKVIRFDQIYTYYSEKIGEKVDFTQLRSKYNQALEDASSKKETVEQKADDISKTQVKKQQLDNAKQTIVAAEIENKQENATQNKNNQNNEQEFQISKNQNLNENDEGKLKQITSSQKHSQQILQEQKSHAEEQKALQEVPINLPITSVVESQIATENTMIPTQEPAAQQMESQKPEEGETKKTGEEDRQKIVGENSLQIDNENKQKQNKEVQVQVGLGEHKQEDNSGECQGQVQKVVESKQGEVKVDNGQRINRQNVDENVN